jgi:hypothetical protein
LLTISTITTKLAQKQLFKAILLLTALAGATLPLTAQTVYEAESSVNSISGSTKIDVCTPCSGHRNAQYIGGPGKGTLTFKNVVAPAAGTYTVAIAYDNGNTANLPASVTVNGGSVQTVNFRSTGSWSTLQTASISVQLVAGYNSIEFQSVNGGYVAEIDKITVTPENVPTSPSPTPSQPDPTPAPSQPDPAPVPPINGDTVSLTNFGSAGKGGNDTQVIQSAINSTAQNGQILEIPASSQPYNVNPLTIPSNAKIVVDAGATIQATSGYSSSQRLLNIINASNVTINGTAGKSIFQMRKSEYTSGEYRHCLDIEGSNNVTISGIACNNSGGDGLYIGEGDQGYSYNVNILNSTFDNNRRQGFSLISGKNITIDGCKFSNTSGTAPQSGIDIEPNTTSDVLQNIVIKNSSASGNQGNGLMISLWETSPASPGISITVSNFSTSNNQQNGYLVENEHDNGTGGPSGNILIQDSSSTLDRAFGAVASYYDTPGPLLTFQNMKVTNANQGNQNWDGAAVGVKRGGGDASHLGNVTFTGTSIIDTTGKLQSYVTVEDYSSVGLKNIHIGSFGTLSGLPSGAPIVIVNGNPQSSVSIP